ncbi:MAG: hypothetical protein AMJ60_04320 [Desulfobacterales bacterium SG8_35]|nr:MAG: hypothetical protein AMJ60_04320 [Desulfobacterales bacterium SG8_35]
MPLLRRTPRTGFFSKFLYKIPRRPAHFDPAEPAADPCHGFACEGVLAGINYAYYEYIKNITFLPNRIQIIIIRVIDYGVLTIEEILYENCLHA